MSFTATVVNGTIKLPDDVDLPDGTVVRVEPAEEEPKTLAERYASFIGIIDDPRTDLALNHDHYLYGCPKK